ncbi:MAG: IclR family transcriptional regulator C-terminal domain-containing protein, partial [Lacisediminimonas sp.]|nr:IclR family transcriptional regulator C-terminal domain-containing protein [Lacisediminimonas sp.]
TGSRLPAYCTSLGRAILAHYSDLELEKYFAATTLRAYTDKTVVSPTRLREILVEVREQGYAMVEEELEVGLHSIAVPVRGASGTVHAALNIGAQSTRVSSSQMVADFLPVLQKVAQDLSILLP